MRASEPRAAGVGTDPVLTAARAGDPDAFAALVGPHERELLVHCYRLLGSLHDAEDALQETFLRAWRPLDGFEGRSTVRAWLYRIATNTCLDALDRASRRVLPHHLSPATDPSIALPPRPDIAWLEPFPTSRSTTPHCSPPSSCRRRWRQTAEHFCRPPPSQSVHNPNELGGERWRSWSTWQSHP
jgi:RNA polymerase sigma factor (sigma-70 family)